MEVHGDFDPGTRTAAVERYEELDPVARTVLNAAARAMGFDRDEYRERVTDDVVAAVRDALFAATLTVTTGTREEFEAWRATVDADVTVVGTETVHNVAWHAPPFADEGVAVTYQDEPEAAIETLRRQAFGRLYREIL